MAFSFIILFLAILLIHDSSQILGYDRLSEKHESLVISFSNKLQRRHTNSINASPQPPLPREFLPPVGPPTKSSNDSNNNHWTLGTIFIVATAGIVILLACCIGATFNKERSEAEQPVDDRARPPPLRRSNPNLASLDSPSDQYPQFPDLLVKPPGSRSRIIATSPPKFVTTPDRKNKEVPLPPPMSTEPSPGLRRYTLHRLKIATNNFSPNNILGKGAFGEVYRGTIGNRTVAIKKLLCENTRGDEDFKTELNAISQVHHRNLISLLGYCIDGPTRLLVYEFAANNSLAHHIRPGWRQKLIWPTRMKIILETAKALMYLHHDCNPGIVHRDIKTGNILLDSEFVAKVADFGIAKFYPDSFVTHLSTVPIGTPGYIDPHYRTSWKLNYKSDVYSFGILVLVLITGHEPSATLEQAKPRLKSAIINKNFDDIADDWLDTNFDHDQMTRIVACAAASISPLQENRPTMKQIVHVLEGVTSPTGFIKEYLLSSQNL